jgi:hypothetical protein
MNNKDMNNITIPDYLPGHQPWFEKLDSTGLKNILP